MGRLDLVTAHAQNLNMGCNPRNVVFKRDLQAIAILRLLLEQPSILVFILSTRLDVLVKPHVRVDRRQGLLLGGSLVELGEGQLVEGHVGVKNLPLGEDLGVGSLRLHADVADVDVAVGVVVRRAL